MGEEVGVGRVSGALWQTFFDWLHSDFSDVGEGGDVGS